MLWCTHVGAVLCTLNRSSGKPNMSKLNIMRHQPSQKIRVAATGCKTQQEVLRLLESFAEDLGFELSCALTKLFPALRFGVIAARVILL
mmetsp:Transcript_30842/g.56425  ORF Transcript_30842/g.56425 Transcript_30842/m.56425 type:complete len:89 (-) Transcript_30842:277-543(-)